MKRALTLIILLLSIAITTTAQQSISAEVGLISSKFFGHTDSPKRKAIIGIRGGLMFDFSLGGDTKLQTGLLYLKNGYTQDFGTGKKTVKVATIEIPFYFQFQAGKHYNRGVFFGIGPYLADNLKAVITYEGTVPVPSLPANINTLGDGINKIDFGLGANFLYQFKFGLYLKGYYQRGFRSFSDEAIINNRNFGFCVGFKLDLSEPDIYASYSSGTPAGGGGNRGNHSNKIRGSY